MMTNPSTEFLSYIPHIRIHSTRPNDFECAPWGDSNRYFGILHGHWWEILVCATEIKLRRVNTDSCQTIYTTGGDPLWVKGSHWPLYRYVDPTQVAVWVAEVLAGDPQAGTHSPAESAVLDALRQEGAHS